MRNSLLELYLIMDMKWILPKDIKQEEPVEYYLISSVVDDRLNVTFDSTGDYLEENHRAQVKQERLEYTQPTVYDDHRDNEPVDPLKPQVTSDYEPDAVTDYVEVEWADGNQKKKSSKIVQKKENHKYKEVIDDDVISTKGPPYACNVCPLTFPIKKSLIAHRSIHKGKKFQCEVCNHVFKSKSHIYEHMKSHLEPQFSCPICLKSFALKKSFVRHQVIHEEKKFECDICNKRFRQKGHVYEHMKIHRERVKRFQCEICDMNYYEQRTLNRHMKFAHSNVQRKRFRCPNALCDKSYSSAPSFRMHACVDGRRPQDMLNTTCPLCNKRFFNKFELNRHTKRTHVTKPENFRCSDCKRSFLYRYWDSYVLHVAQKCAKVIVYECDYCSKLLPSKAKLVEHFAAVHDIDNTAKKIHCPKCTKFFFNENNLNHHLKRNHIEITCAFCNLKLKSKSGHSLHQKQCMPKKTFEKYSQRETSVADDASAGSTHVCEICKCSFITKANLREHQTEVHVEKNFVVKDDKVVTLQYSCSTCNMTLSSRMALSKHKKRMHKSRRQFKCPTCNVTFIGEELYQKHFRNSKCKKKELRRHQCSVCSKIFSRNSNLKIHFRTIHLNERVGTRYVCDICQRSFISKWLIRKHFLRGDHRNSLQCEFCPATFKHISACWKHSTYCKSRPQTAEA